MKGRVVSTKMKGTVTVLVERVAKHPLYKKTFLRSKRYLVDAFEDVRDGDIVEIIKVRPISKNKHWKVAKVVGKNLVEIVEAREKEVAKEAIAEIMPEEKKEEPSALIKSESAISHQTGKEKEKPKNKKRKESLKG